MSGSSLKWRQEIRVFRGRCAGMKDREQAAEMGLSVGRVNQIRNRAIGRTANALGVTPDLGETIESGPLDVFLETELLRDVTVEADIFSTAICR